MSGAAPAAGHGLDPFHTMIGSGPDHVRRRGPTPGASGCPSGPRANRRRVRRLPHGRCRRNPLRIRVIAGRRPNEGIPDAAEAPPQCRSRRITLRRHRERREEKPMQRRLLPHCAASTGDKLRVIPRRVAPGEISFRLDSGLWVDSPERCTPTGPDVPGLWQVGEASL